MDSIDIIFTRETVGGYVPRSGVGVFNERKIWFLKEHNIDNYHAWYLTPEEYDIFESEHIDMCEKTGRPLMYGDEIIQLKPFSGFIKYSMQCPKREKDFTFDKTKFSSYIGE